jgi:hypothetical protein
MKKMVKNGHEILVPAGTLQEEQAVADGYKDFVQPEAKPAPAPKPAGK